MISGVQSGDSRGQLVLIAALALTLVLVALGVAYLQLGYNEDVQTVEQRPASQIEAVLERIIDKTATDVPNMFHWSDRDTAAQAVRDELNATSDQLETSRLGAGHLYHITLNDTRTAHWESANCPAGPNRQFGTCETIGGIAVQNRTGRTHVLAAAFDIMITTPNGETAVTVVIKPQAKYDDA
ncbi:hypothetical protein ACFQJ7_10185 [Halovenus rubra]|uniref:Uncharacterized protein n=2 Tax=Halovenus rubra TaxID=869890 RepID=A0ACC7DWY1_9EURY|nr:hypothetical protein [Halovenus rubra]